MARDDDATRHGLSSSFLFSARRTSSPLPADRRRRRRCDREKEGHSKRVKRSFQLAVIFFLISPACSSSSQQSCSARIRSSSFSAGLPSSLDRRACPRRPEEKVAPVVAQPRNGRSMTRPTTRCKRREVIARQRTSGLPTSSPSRLPASGSCRRTDPHAATHRARRSCDRSSGIRPGRP